VVDGFEDEFFEPLADVVVQAKCHMLHIIHPVELHELELGHACLIMEW